MSTRREDDSRPRASSQRPTARDVPVAKNKDVLVGTAPPGALRGASLMPGQGAPERIDSKDVELAVLRDAETLDGPRVARVAARRQAEPANSPSPVPVSVSVEVTRARSLPPALGEVPSTPPSPSARSIQSGTLLSVGSVDARAPTERSLPSPLPLSVSERALYFGPTSVVDRTAASVASLSRPDATRTSLSPTSRALASEARAHPIPSSQPQIFEPPSPLPRARAYQYRPPSSGLASEVPARFGIHSEIGALAPDFVEDNFDLRGALTDREPLAGRKREQALVGPGAVSAPAASVALLETGANAGRARTDAITLPAAGSPAAAENAENAEPTAKRRAARVVSWLLLTLTGSLVVWLTLRLLAAAEPPREPVMNARDPRATAAPPGAKPVSEPTGGAARRVPSASVSSGRSAASATSEALGSVPNDAAHSAKGAAEGRGARATPALFPDASPRERAPAAADSGSESPHSIY